MHHKTNLKFPLHQEKLLDVTLYTIDMECEQLITALDLKSAKNIFRKLLYLLRVIVHVNNLTVTKFYKLFV